jgi:threonine aldolase
MISFASDNAAPAAPEVLAALAAASRGTVHSYGDDPWTKELAARAEAVFGRALAIYPVATGTAANALALATLVPPYGAVICHEGAHINTDECGAPEFYTGGAKMLTVPGRDGKMRPEQIAPIVAHAEAMGVHSVQPAAVSITQSTEWGTVYTPDEVRALAEAAHAHGLALHMDGARLANAVAYLGCSPAEATWQAGVDVLSFGGTKNGALAAEAVIFFDPARAAGFERRRKRAGQLWSKLRYMSAQLLALLEEDRWLAYGAQANRMAARLGQGLARVAGARLVQPVQANELFAALPQAVIDGLLAEGFDFYPWPTPPGESGALVRLVTSYATTDAEVDAFLAAAERLAGR